MSTQKAVAVGQGVAPISYERLIYEITERHPGMRRVGRLIARHVVQNPNEVALLSAKAIAGRIGIQASSLVRFAQAFGYSGFADMQQVFQARLVSAQPGMADRIDILKRDLGGASAPTKVGLLRDLAIRDIAALHRLIETAGEHELQAAGALLAAAPTIHVMGQLRSFPIASYLHYAFVRLRRDARLIDGAGGLAFEQAELVRPGHAVIAISFRFYARDVVDIAVSLADRDVPLIAITDSQLSPLAKRARVTLLVPEAESAFSSSLAAPICLAQALVLAMAHELRPDVAPTALTAESLALAG